MKKTFLMLGLLSFSLISKAQYGRVCAGTGSYSPSNWPSTGCSAAVIDSFIPKSTDPVLHYKVSIHLFKKTSGVGNFDNVTYHNCQTIVNNISQEYNSLLAPTLPTSPAQPFVSDPRMDFTLTNVFWHVDDNAFLSGFPHNPINNNYFYQLYGDPNSYNVFLVADPSFNASWTSYYNATPYMNLPSTYYNYGVFDSTNLGAGLYCHELGHGLGFLKHTADTADCNNNSPYWQNPYSPPDFTIEDAKCADNKWGWYPCTPGVVSNNIMGQNQCYRYLSPKQLACYHANYKLGVTSQMTTNGVYDSTNNSVYVSGNQTWSNYRLITGDLVVNGGAQLTINCTIAFVPGARLIVEPMGKLILDGGTLTSACSITGMTFANWSGVQVWGSSNQDESTLRTPVGMPAHQGMISIINGGTIQYAQTAILAGASYNSSGIDFTRTGGIIQAVGASFIGNEQDVEFLLYQKATSASYFKGCTFNQNGLPTASNIAADRVHLYGINGVKFYGNTFIAKSGTLTDPLKGNAISSIDAGYTLDDYIVSGVTTHNTFNVGLGNLFVYAIYAQNTAIFNPIIVNNCVFNYAVKGEIYMNQMHYSTITNNTFTIKAAGSTPTTPDYAVYLDNCHGYSVRGNNITGFLANGIAHPHAGIIVNNGGTGANSVYNNTFINLNMGLWAQGQNQGGTPAGSTGLIMNCNNFTTCTQDIGIVGPALPTGATNGVLNVQGSTTNLALYVRNSYSAGSGGNFNRYYTLNNNYQIKHPSYANTSVIYQPSPQQTFSDSNFVKIMVEPGTYSSTYCPASCTGCRTLPQVHQSIQQHKISLLNMTDGSTQKQSAKDELVYEQNEAGNLANEKIRNFLNDTTLSNPIDSVIAVLNQKHNPNDKKMLAKAHIQKGDYAKAQSYLDTLLAEDSNNKDFYDMHQRMITMHSNPASYIGSLKNSGGLKNTLLQLANNRNKESCTQAQTLLGLAFGSYFQEPIIMPENTNNNGSRFTKNENTVSVIDESIKMYPNPTNTNLFIEYNIGANEAVKVNISDVNGRTIKSALLTSETKINQIDVSEMINGVYFVTLFNNNNLISNKKIVIMK